MCLLFLRSLDMGFDEKDREMELILKEIFVRSN
jgi:hypothetical protein